MVLVREETIAIYIHAIRTAVALFDTDALFPSFSHTSYTLALSLAHTHTHTPSTSYGDIGRACATLAKAFGMKILALKRRPGAKTSLRLKLTTALVSRCLSQALALRGRITTDHRPDRHVLPIPCIVWVETPLSRPHTIHPALFHCTADAATDAGSKGGKGDGLADELMGPAQINELMVRSDYVIVAAALTPETRGMVGKEQFGHSKRGQVLINIGRGPLVVERDLLEVCILERDRGVYVCVWFQLEGQGCSVEVIACFERGVFGVWFVWGGGDGRPRSIECVTSGG